MTTTELDIATASDNAAESDSVAEPAPATASLSVRKPCIHCGEQTLCGPADSSESIFCCKGCQGAYQLINGLGLEDFYSLRDSGRSVGQAYPADQQAEYAQYNDPEFLGRSAPKVSSDGTAASTLLVQGIHCAACSWLIENALTREPGVLSARVRMSNHSIEVYFKPEVIRLSKIARLLDSMGYRLRPCLADDSQHFDTQNRYWLVQIAIAAFLAMNSMWIAIALYSGAQFSLQYRYFFNLIGMALGLAAVLGPGLTFLKGAFAALRTRTPHMDLPVALGLSIGAIVGSINAIRGVGHAYFDSLATLVFLLLIGRWIQFRQQTKAARAVDLLMRLTPRHASLVGTDGTTRRVLAESLNSGDMVEVLSGDAIPADGKFVAIRRVAMTPNGLESTNDMAGALVDCSLLTGESKPINLQHGDTVSAGAINLGVPIHIAVQAVASESRIGKIMQLVESAAGSKPPIVQFADRIGAVFVVAVTVLACVTFAWWSFESISTATSHATALLIVACPCALALATPLAIAVALGRAAQRGILVSDGNALQQLARPGTIWFDKTGTLTLGKLQVTSLCGLNHQKCPTATLNAAIRLAASIEQHCKHPIADALADECKRRDLNLISDVHSLRTTRCGVEGNVGEFQVCVGNANFIEATSRELTSSEHAQVSELAERGESPLLIGIDGTPVALVGLSDPVRQDARQIVDRLRKKGWEIGILSGDHSEIVRQVGMRLGIDREQCLGAKSPEQKLAIVERSKATRRKVVMVGDGANDAVALAAADVGVALRGGAEVSLLAAPVFLSHGHLLAFADLIDASRKTQILIVVTMAVSLSYNLIAVGLAMAGAISPLVAAILMPISSVSVLALTLGFPTFQEAEQ